MDARRQDTAWRAVLASVRARHRPNLAVASRFSCLQPSNDTIFYVQERHGKDLYAGCMYYDAVAAELRDGWMLTSCESLDLARMQLRNTQALQQRALAWLSGVSTHDFVSALARDLSGAPPVGDGDNVSCLDAEAAVAFVRARDAGRALPHVPPRDAAPTRSGELARVLRALIE